MFGSQQETQQQDNLSAIMAIGGRIQRLADKCYSERLNLEQRWAEDTRQYNGEYDPQTQNELAASGRSQAFVNLTQPKVAIAEGRLAEMVAPTDDKNWAISPTPLPDNVRLDSKNLDMLQKELQDKAKRMEQVIYDQLQECDYNAQIRDVCHNAAMLGTGIMKGVTVTAESNTKWMQRNDALGNTMYIMERTTQYKPEVISISPWDFFPDMSANKIEHASFAFHRHRFTKKQMRALKDQGFDSESIVRALAEQAGTETTSQPLSTRSQTYANVQRDIYEVWEYHGSLERDELELLGCQLPDDSPLAELYEVPSIVWVCNGQVLKASPSLSDTGELPFSVFCWQDDDDGIFGFGVPYQMRHSQRVCNSTWRMVLDNAAMSVMPQLIVDDRAIAPVDGSPVIRPAKVWKRLDRNIPINESFVSIPIASNIQALAQIFQQAKSLMDEETGMPLIAQGMNAPEVNNQTAQGMSMLMSSALTPMRRLVKRFDDNITSPLISRFYDWNMQYSDDDSIKGDYKIIANGSTALVEKEQTAMSLAQALQIAGSNPVLAQMTKFPDLYRKLIQSMGVKPELIVKTDDEIKAEQERMAQQPQQPDPETMKLQLEQQKLQLQAQEIQADMQLRQQQMQIDNQFAQVKSQVEIERMNTARMEVQGEIQEREIERETQMMKMATDRDLTIAQVQSQLVNAREQRAHETDLFTAEAKIKLSQGSGI
jgi:hypothetical protein